MMHQLNERILELKAHYEAVKSIRSQSSSLSSTSGTSSQTSKVGVEGDSPKSLSRPVSPTLSKQPMPAKKNLSDQAILSTCPLDRPLLSTAALDPAVLTTPDKGVPSTGPLDIDKAAILSTSLPNKSFLSMQPVKSEGQPTLPLRADAPHCPGASPSMTLDDHTELYESESWNLLVRRWSKLEKDFKFPDGSFAISKIPDIYDCIKYDCLHNSKLLKFDGAMELYRCVKFLSDIVVPQVC